MSVTRARRRRLAAVVLLAFFAAPGAAAPWSEAPGSEAPASAAPGSAESGSASPERSLEMLVEITDFTGLSISPDGRYGVYRAERASVEDNDYSSAWFVFRLGKDEPPRRIADGGAPLFSAGWALGEWPRWSSDARSIYFRALINGEAQIWRATLAGEARRVTDDPADIQAFALLAGEVLAYETGPARAEIRRAEIEEYDAGVRIDETVPVGQGLFRSGLVHGRLATQRYLGDWMNVTTLLGDRASSVTIHKPGKEEPRAANKNEEAAFRRLVDGPTLSEEDAAPGRSASASSPSRSPTSAR